MPNVDSTAKVHARAELADDVVIGPYTVVGEHVRIGAGTVVDSHGVITGHTELGARNHIHPYASIGTPPQDHTYRGEPTRLLIGDENEVREFVTINTGTLKGGGVTIIGNENLFMACSHVAHDCMVADRVVLSNGALLAGHVKAEDGAILSGLAAVHHFVTLGSVCMVGGLTGVAHDVPPYLMMVNDNRMPRGVNAVGMQRNGFSAEDIRSVQKAFRLIYRSKLSRDQAIGELENSDEVAAPVATLIASLRRSEIGKRGRYLEVTRESPGGEA